MTLSKTLAQSVAAAGAALLLTTGGALAYECGGMKSATVASVEEPRASGVAESYVGLTLAAAQEIADEEGRLFRVVRIDGEPQMTTKDFRPGRVNVEILDGIVVVAELEGEPAS